MTTPIRNYRGKDVEMLITTSTIVESAITNKEFLISKRPIWAGSFFEDTKKQIDTSIQANLGIDNAKDLRQSTQALTKIQTSAIADLALFKVQVTEDFKEDKVRQTEILTQLGLHTFLKQTQNGDQEALINLLFQYKTNMSPALITEISSKGTDPTLITTITGYADTLKNANITQETVKGSKKSITANTLKEFNSIYNKVISIAKIAAKLFKGQPDIQSQFSYTKVLKALNNTTPNTPKAPK